MNLTKTKKQNCLHLLVTLHTSTKLGKPGAHDIKSKEFTEQILNFGGIQFSPQNMDFQKYASLKQKAKITCFKKSLGCKD